MACHCSGRLGKNKSPQEKPWLAGESASFVACSLFACGKKHISPAFLLRSLKFQESIHKLKAKIWLINVDFFQLPKTRNGSSDHKVFRFYKLKSDLIHEDMVVPALILPDGEWISLWYFHLIVKMSGNQKGVPCCHLSPICGSVVPWLV